MTASGLSGAATGAALLLGERVTFRLFGAGLAIMVGVALSVLAPRRAPPR